MDAHRVLFVAILILFAFPPQVHAQGVARSFEQLQLLVRTGDTVTVRDWSGAQTTGKIESLSSSTLIFVTSRGRQDLREADVAAILQRRGDSLANGAVWGLGFGLLAGGTLAALMCSDGPCDASLALGVAIYGGIGAGIGTGVDGLISRRQLIYEGPTRASVAVGLGPLLGIGRRGMTLRLRF